MKILSSSEIQQAAEILLDATEKATPIERLTARFGDFGAADAYRIQFAGLKLRLAKGPRQIGWKMGLTSESKRKQMSLNSAIFGYLLDAGWEKGNDISPKGMIHPKGEPEIAFRMKKKLSGKVDRKTAQDAIATCFSAIEVIDSRYIGFKYFSLPDVIADNCSAGRYFFGEEIAYSPRIDLAVAQMTFKVGEENMGTVAGAEISGDPIHSLMQLSEMLGENDLELKEGDYVLAGAATPAVALSHGQDFSLDVTQLPPLRFKVI